MWCATGVQLRSHPQDPELQANFEDVRLIAPLSNGANHSGFSQSKEGCFNLHLDYCLAQSRTLFLLRSLLRRTHDAETFRA